MNGWENQFCSPDFPKEAFSYITIYAKNYTVLGNYRQV